MEVEAAATGGQKRLPRELRNLAVPDRQWNVAMPFYTTATKTREQFSSNPDAADAAAVARENHQRRVASALDPAPSADPGAVGGAGGAVEQEEEPSGEAGAAPSGSAGGAEPESQSDCQ